MLSVIDSKKVLEDVRNRLNHFLGLNIILDVYARKKYGKSFAELVLVDPDSAYKLLASILNNSRTAEIVLSYIKKPLRHHESIRISIE